jgi:hypothetical protein
LLKSCKLNDEITDDCRRTLNNSIQFGRCFNFSAYIIVGTFTVNVRPTMAMSALLPVPSANPRRLGIESCLGSWPGLDVQQDKLRSSVRPIEEMGRYIATAARRVGVLFCGRG